MAILSKRLDAYLKEREISREDFRAAMHRAFAERKGQRQEARKREIKRDAMEQTMRDLGLSEKEVLQALELVAAEQKERSQLWGRIAIISTALLAVAIFFSFVKNRSAEKKLSALKLKYAEVEVQERRGVALVSRLSGLIDKREGAKFDRYRKLLREHKAKDLPTIIDGLSGVLNDEAFLKLMDEVSGAHNRLTVARRRYRVAYQSFHDSLSSLDKLFIDENEMPPQPGEVGELRTGH